MNFYYPQAFFLLIPWVIFCFIVYFNQNSAVSWIQKNISKRFQSNFTRYNLKNIWGHITVIFFLGSTLIWTLAGPYSSGDIKQDNAYKNVFIVVDASYSMYAKDTKSISHNDVKGKSRFEVAKKITSDLIEKLKNDKVGLITFSGTSVIRSLPTFDHDTLKSLVQNLNIHQIQSTGSNFEVVLDDLIHSAHSTKEKFAVVIISDGEALPENQKLEERLDALDAVGIPIHTIGLGTWFGQNIDLFDPKDIVNKVAYPKVIKTVKTSRNASYLKDISSATDGEYFELEGGDWVQEVVEELADFKDYDSEIFSETKQGRVDTTTLPLVLFVILFFIELFILFPKPAVFLIFISFSFMSCKNKVLNAHKENETGIDRYTVSLKEQARKHFERSALFRIKEDIPLLNLGNNYIKNKQYKDAHTYFQRAMHANPAKAEVYFNDGVALFLWAEDELDPEGCYLAKSAELYDQAIARFEEAKARGINVDANIEYIKKRIKDLYLMHYAATHCQKQNQNNSNQGYKSKHAPPPPSQGGQNQKNKNNKQNQNNQNNQQNQQNQQQNQKNQKGPSPNDKQQNKQNQQSQQNQNNNKRNNPLDQNKQKNQGNRPDQPQKNNGSQGQQKQNNGNGQQQKNQNQGGPSQQQQQTIDLPNKKNKQNQQNQNNQQKNQKSSGGQLKNQKNQGQGNQNKSNKGQGQDKDKDKQNKSSQGQGQQQQKNKPKLSDKEKQDIKSNLERIKKDSQQNQGFNQTGNEKAPSDESKIDKELLW